MKHGQERKVQHNLGTVAIKTPNSGRLNADYTEVDFWLLNTGRGSGSRHKINGYINCSRIMNIGEQRGETL